MTVLDDVRASLKVKIIEAKPRDVGKKRIRIDEKDMKTIQVKAGDLVKIVGDKTSCAVVWPADEDDKLVEVVRMDGQSRKNIGTSLYDHITITSCKSQNAASIEIIPIYEKMNSDYEFTDFVKNRIKNMPLIKGDEISVVILGNSIEFKIGKTTPDGVVTINEFTKLSILENITQDTKTHIMYDEIGGLEEEVSTMRDIVEMPLRHPELFRSLGIEAQAGILLYGPPGCGKTLIVKVLASESYANMYIINGPEILNKYYGETEAKLREIFKEAKENSPSIIFIDEIDAIAPRRESAQGEVEKRIVGQLLALMDGVTDRGNVIVLGATNRPDSIDPALRRPGRFDKEIEIPVPNIESRTAILQIYTRGMPLKSEIKIKSLASDLIGYTGADIKLLCREAAVVAIKRYLPKNTPISSKIPSSVLQSMVIKRSDFYEAMQKIVPATMREFYIEQPKIIWDNIVGLEKIKKQLKENFVLAINDPYRFDEIGIKPPKGILLYGPTGCGKSLLAQALATECKASIIYVHGADMLSRWEGESEKAIKKIFLKAKSSTPCIIIFDEFEIIAGKREHVNTLSSQIISQIQNSIPQVCVIGITNRPDMIDSSVCAAGRLDISLYVPPPNQNERLGILKILVKKFKLSNDVNLEEIAQRTHGYTGGDLSIICRSVVISSIHRDNHTITHDDFNESLAKIRPSVSKEMIKSYEDIQQGLSSINIDDKNKGLYS